MLLKKIRGIAAVFAVCAVFTWIAGSLPHFSFARNTAAQNVRFILDAGHGNPDGGAVGADGTTEAELNLAIIRKVSELLNQKSVNHILTRTDENSIFSEGETIHAKKVSDIRNRIAIATANPAIPVISIHMNSYPSSSVRGIQVFYGEGSEEAQKLADSLQHATNERLQPDHTKTTKTIPKNVYFFANISNPSILIECGFVSNTEELQKLKTEEYQMQLAQIIADVLTAES